MTTPIRKPIGLPIAGRRSSRERVFCGGRSRRCGFQLGERGREEIQGTGDYSLSYWYLRRPPGWRFDRRAGDFAVYLVPTRQPRRPMAEAARGIAKGPVYLDAKGRGVIGIPLRLPATVVCPECDERNEVP